MSARTQKKVADAERVADKLAGEGRKRDAEIIRALCRNSRALEQTASRLHQENMMIRNWRI